MRNYNEWEDMVGTNGRYKIRLAEDNRTVEVGRRRGVKRNPTLKFRRLNEYHVFSICYTAESVKTMKAHQLSYKQWVDNSYMPSGLKMVIDHIDGDIDNNHPDNLRLVTHRENCSKERTKKSGLPTGVVWSKEKRKYVAQITIEMKNKNLGYFHDPSEASQAYQDALHRINTLGHV